MLLKLHQSYRIWWFTMCVGYAACLSENDLIPFTNGTEDKAMPDDDDDYISVDFQTTFKFLGVTYPRTIYITPDLVELMTDTELKDYLPQHGDRLRLRKYLREEKSPKSSRKNKLLSILQEKLQKRRNNPQGFSSDEDSTSQASMPRQVRLYGNRNAMKDTRTIELGWIHRTHKRTKQVRKKTGGGTRKIEMSKNATRTELLEEATSLFFKNGESPKGKLSDFEKDIWDFSEHKLEDGKTIQEVIDETKMASSTIRFYLATWKKTNDTMPGNDILSIAMTTSGLSDFHSTSEAPENTLPDMDFLLQVPELDENSGTISAGKAQKNPDVRSTVLPDLEPTFNNFSDLPDLDFPMPELQVPQDMPKPVDEVVVRVHRGHILMDMISAFKTIDPKKAIISFEMVMPNGKIEVAEDGGGVTRDTLTEFWGEFYENCTLGTYEKVPFLRHDFADTEWQSVAKIILFGWNKEGYYPVALSKQFMSQCLFGQVNEKELLESFFNHLPEVESACLKESANNFGSVDKEELCEYLDSHECRKLPTEENIKKLLTEVAHKELIQTPMFVADCWIGTLMEMLTNEQFCSNYQNLKPTARAVCKVLKFPEIMTPEETIVSNHLKRYIRELNSELLKKFVRFCTGSDLLLAHEIKVQFVSVTGLARRPVAHTCSNVLELSRSFDSFPEFRAEFSNVLESSVWVMDIV